MVRKFYDVYVEGVGGGVYVVKHRNYTAKEVIECQCGTHLLQVISETGYYENSDNTKQANQEFYFAMFGYGNQRKGLFLRLRIAWNYLRTGKMFTDQLTLNSEEAKKLVDFIHSNNVLNPERSVATKAP